MIELESLSDVSEDTIALILDEMTALLQEHRPDLEMKRGVVSDAVIQPHAVLTAKHRDELQRYLDARSLLQLSADPTLADDDSVDHALSNFNISRQDGSAATGEITIVVSLPTTVIIPEALTFVANGISYTSNEVYVGRPDSAQVVSDSDREMQRLGDGNYAFTVFVTASVSGSEGLISRGTLAIPEIQPTNYVTSYATGDFSGGEVPETNQALILRLQEGIAAKVPSNRVNMSAMLKEYPDFERITTTSVVGLADTEMTRD